MHPGESAVTTMPEQQSAAARPRIRQLSATTDAAGGSGGHLSSRERSRSESPSLVGRGAHTRPSLTPRSSCKSHHHWVVSDYATTTRTRRCGPCWDTLHMDDDDNGTSLERRREWRIQVRSRAGRPGPLLIGSETGGGVPRLDGCLVAFFFLLLSFFPSCCFCALPQPYFLLSFCLSFSPLFSFLFPLSECERVAAATTIDTRQRTHEGRSSPPGLPPPSPQAPTFSMVATPPPWRCPYDTHCPFMLLFFVVCVASRRDRAAPAPTDQRPSRSASATLNCARIKFNREKFVIRACESAGPQALSFSPRRYSWRG